MNHKRLLVIVLLFLSCIFAVAAGFWVFNNSKNAADKIVESKKEIAEAERKEANIKLLEDLLASIAPEEQKISGIFTDSGNLVAFIEKLEVAAQDAGVSLKIESAELTSGDKKNKENLPHFNIISRGSFGQNFRYLELLESMPFQIEIKDAALTMRSEEKVGKYWEFRASITLLSFLNI